MKQTIQLTESAPNMQRFVLDNGITLISSYNPSVNIIAARLFLKAGSLYETRNKAGLSHLLAAVLTKGTQRHSAAEIAEEVESVGASLGMDAAADYFVISLKTVATDFVPMLNLVGEMMRTPTFPTSEVELERHLTIQSIRSQHEQPFNTAFSQLREAMYQNYPYGVSVLGLEETVACLGRDDIEQYHHTYFRPDNLVISISGCLKPEEALGLTKEVFGDWQKPDAPLPTIELPSITNKPCETVTKQDSQQAIIMVGYLTPSVHHRDYIPLKLINTYLGNGLSSRLFVELREKRGLAYDVSAFYPTRLGKSQFAAYIGTAPENTAIALEGLTREVERLTEVKLSLEEIQAAKNKLLGQYALGKQSNGEIAQLFGWYETLGLGIEFDTHFQEEVAKVTPEILQEVACRYFCQSPYISVVASS